MEPQAATNRAASAGENLGLPLWPLWPQRVGCPKAAPSRVAERAISCTQVLVPRRHHSPAAWISCCPSLFSLLSNKPTTSTDTIHTATCLVQSRRRDSDSPASPTQPASEADDRTIGGDDEGDKHDAMTQAATDEAGIQSDSWLDESDEHDDCSFPTGDMAAVDGGRRGSLGL